MDSHLSLEVISNKEQLTSISNQWNRLLSRSEANSIFLTWEWISSWIEVYGEAYEIYTIVVRDPKSIIQAIGPFIISKKSYWGSLITKKVLTFIGYGEEVTPEYLDLIVDPRYKEVATTKIVNELLKFDHFDLMDLKPISDQSYFGAYIIEVVSHKRIFAKVQRFSICPIALLPDTWDKFMNSKSKNFRKKSKEYLRVCQRDLDPTFRCLSSKDKSSLAVSTLSFLHRMRWNQVSSAFKTDTYNDFHKRIANAFAERNWLRMFILYDRHQPIAANYCYFYNNTYYFYQSGRDLNYSKYRVGFVLMNFALQYAIDESAKLFDFLTGNESYKYRWANKKLRCIRALILPLGFISFLIYISEPVISFIKKQTVRILKSSNGN